jgi:hypothetical protein
MESTVKWGIFRTPKEDAIEIFHIVPCYPDGWLFPDHELSEKCKCNPSLDNESPPGRKLWIHEMIQ